MCPPRAIFALHSNRTLRAATVCIACVFALAVEISIFLVIKDKNSASLILRVELAFVLVTTTCLIYGIHSLYLKLVAGRIFYIFTIPFESAIQLFGFTVMNNTVVLGGKPIPRKWIDGFMLFSLALLCFLSHFRRWFSQELISLLL